MELTDPGTYKSSNKVPRSSPGESSCLQVLGIIPGEDFAPSTLTPEQLHAVNEGVHARSAHVESFADKSHLVKPGWNTFIRNVGRYGTDNISIFTDRAGQPLNGLARYLGKSRSDIREAYEPTAGLWFHGDLEIPMGIVLDIMVAQSSS